VLVIPDVHFPRHDRAAVRATLEFAQKIKPRRIVLLGDVIEAAAFSSHPKGSLHESPGDIFEEEYAPARLFLDELESCSKQVDYVSGNHEYRVERIAASCGFVRSVYKAISPKAVLSSGRSRKSFKWHDYNPTKRLSGCRIAHDLYAIHGWSHAKHAAHVHITAGKGISLVFGHVHRRVEAIWVQPFTRKRIEAWSPGCLSQLIPTWQHSPNDWTQGLSVIDVRNDLKAWKRFSVVIENGELHWPSNP